MASRQCRALWERGTNPLTRDVHMYERCTRRAGHNGRHMANHGVWAMFWEDGDRWASDEKAPKPRKRYPGIKRTKKRDREEQFEKALARRKAGAWPTST